MSSRSNRRSFLQTTATTGIGFWLSGGLQAQESKSPNERIAFACIGLGNMGRYDSAEAAKAGDVVAICEVDERTLNNAGERKFPEAKRYVDFRKMFDEMGKSIDAVTVSTPDHVHAPIALTAMRMGIHCYCQKPLARTLCEVRRMAQVAREQKVVAEMGNQGTAHAQLRRAAAVVQSGALGAVKEIHAWTDRPTWPQGGDRPKPVDPPPGLNWDLWLGPAPERPFANGYHPMSWRGWWDFGSGAVGDMACHLVNMPYMALDLRDPVAVQAETSGHNGESYPKGSVITYDFPALGDRPAVKLFWYDGGNLPTNDTMARLRELFSSEIEEARSKGDNYLGNGCIMIGEKDSLLAPSFYCEKEPRLASGSPLPEVSFIKSPGHFAEFVRAIRTGEPVTSDFANYAGGLTESILVGNLAVWVAASGKGEKLEWDAKNLKCTNIAGLEPLIKPTYRAGYTLD